MVNTGEAVMMKLGGVGDCRRRHFGSCFLSVKLKVQKEDQDKFPFFFSFLFSKELKSL